MKKLHVQSDSTQERCKAHFSTKDILSKALRAAVATAVICLQTYPSYGAPEQLGRKADFSVFTSNWSGYISDISGVLAQRVVGVNGTFNVPKVSSSCFIQNRQTSFAMRYEVAVWIGIGGTEENSLVQTGIIAQKSVLSFPTSKHSTKAPKFSYIHISPFYEMLPNPPVRLHGMDMHQGDEVSASISKLRGTRNDFTIRITDDTNGKSFKKIVIYPVSQAYPLPKMSAEWIVERPAHDLNTTSFFKMPKFSQVDFKSSGMEANYLGLKGRMQYSISSMGELVKIDMSDDGTSKGRLTSTSNLSDVGTRFAVTESMCARMK